MATLAKAGSNVDVVDPPDLDAAEVHTRHAGFVWSTLQRFGVRDADLEDLLQEVFVVVHQRLHTYDRTSRLTTWLYGICKRLASTYRRSAYVRREVIDGRDADEAEGTTDNAPDEEAAVREARVRLAEILDAMELERRAVFVMFEIEGMACPEIADITGAPIGTVYGRLAAARKDFESAVQRYTARDAHRGKR